MAKRIRTRYWKPGDDFLGTIAESVANLCQDGDIVVVSEKAVSVAMGRVVNEAEARPGLLARVLVRIWIRLIWGYALGSLCHLSKTTLQRLRQYPIPEGQAHKEVALRYAGFNQALLYYSEGGIDVTNLPYAFASLPLDKPEDVSDEILRSVQGASGKKVSVMIIDTDKTYSKNGLHFSPRPNSIQGIRSLGLFALVFGRILRWEARATPLAISGTLLSVEKALDVADAADRAMGYGAGRTVWDMAKKFRVDLTEVSWEMLDRVRHYPVVLVKKNSIGNSLSVLKVCTPTQWQAPEPKLICPLSHLG
jgi:F420-0:gamma-glutamyl ligase-like protein